MARWSHGHPWQRLARVQRLLDLYDAARFGSDAARLTLTPSIEGLTEDLTEDRGPAASATTLDHLLNEALALESAQPLQHNTLYAHEVAQLIALLSADQGPDQTIDDSATKLLAYRHILELAPSMVQDNAQWRRFDYARGFLELATRAPARTRRKQAALAMLLVDEQVEPYLREGPSAARPNDPTPDELWHLVAQPLSLLAQDPQWASLARAKLIESEALRQTARSALPAPRTVEPWLPRHPQGCGRGEHFGPLVYVMNDSMVIDAHRPQARTLAHTASHAARTRALNLTLASDGRGVLTVTIEPGVRSADLFQFLQASAASTAEKLEFACAEPSLTTTDAWSVAAWPLGPKLRNDVATALAPRLLASLSGFGVRFIVDGSALATLATTARDQQAMLHELRALFPRQTTLALHIGNDVVPNQLYGLLHAALDGEGAFEQLQWLPELDLPSIPTHGDAVLARRRAWLPWVAAWHVAQPYPLKQADQAHLEQWTPQLAACVLELDVPPERTSAFTVSLHLAHGRVVGVDAPAGADAVAACIRELSWGFRLQHHAEALTLVATLSGATQ